MLASEGITLAMFYNESLKYYEDVFERKNIMKMWRQINRAADTLERYDKQHGKLDGQITH